MKILNIKGLKTISKSQQQSISGGRRGNETPSCYDECMKSLADLEYTLAYSNYLCRNYYDS